jgi:hypothetical protein
VQFGAGRPARVPVPFRRRSRENAYIEMVRELPTIMDATPDRLTPHTPTRFVMSFSGVGANEGGTREPETKTVNV